MDEGWFEGTHTKPLKLSSGETLPATVDELDFLRQLGLEDTNR